MPREKPKGIGPIRPEDETPLELDWDKLSPHQKFVIGMVIDKWLAWAQTVPEIMSKVKENEEG